MQASKSALKDSGLVDDDTAQLVGGVMDAVENQAEAGRDASIADRLKMVGRDCWLTENIMYNSGYLCISLMWPT